VIEDNKPLFIGVSEMLRRSTDNTVLLLKSELEIQLSEFEEQWHFASLERIFIENRIYRDIEEEETWEGVILAIDKGLKPHTKHLKRAVLEEDIVRLTEIRIKRISKFDIDKAQQKIDALEDQIAEVKHHLANLIDYAIAFFERLKKEYGKGRERQTEIRTFDDVDATKVVIRNTKLYVNREEGFVGTALKKDEYVCDCSDIDDIIVFTADGKMMVSKVDAKTFVGKDIIHVAVFKKKDKRTIYNMIYKDGSKGPSYVKRFSVTSTTRDKEYDLTNGNKGSMVWYFSANPNGEAEMVTIYLRQVGSIKKLKWDLDFAEVLIKGRASKGNLVTKHAIKKVELKEKGVSTLKPRKIWFDDTVQRLNVDERGELVGEFRGEDRILIITQSGMVKTIIPEITTHFDDDMIVMEKWIPRKPISAIYFDGEKERYYVKRFLIENEAREESFISEHPNSQLEIVSTDWRPIADVEFTKERGKDRKDNMQVNFEEFIAVKGISALGNQLTKDKINQVSLLDPLPYEAPEEVPAEEIEVIDETDVSEENTSKPSNNDDDEPQGTLDDKGQITLF
jgi:topoisomerase-4 subunit A